MPDNFGQYADTVQGGTVTFLKSERSVQRWGVRQRPLARTILQFGVDGGPGITHGITDPAYTTLLMQVTDFDDRVFLDGVPCPSRVLIVLPPDSHFTVTRSGPLEWFSWSIPKSEAIALKMVPAPLVPTPLKTEKVMVGLGAAEASRLRRTARHVLDIARPSSTDDGGQEDILFDELESAWEKRDSTTSLPCEETHSAEQIVFRALKFVQSRPDQAIEINALAKAGGVGYRTLLRAFERYLKIPPKHYLKLRQINNVYHAIRKCGGATVLADILSAHGVTEFGRFAGEYRSIFGEPPSATLQRCRLAKLDRIAPEEHAPASTT